MIMIIMIMAVALLYNNRLIYRNKKVILEEWF
jgi:hypothetical protein